MKFLRSAMLYVA